MRPPRLTNSLFALVSSAALLLFSAGAHAAAEVGKAAPEFSATAIDGSNVSLARYKGKIIVLEWTNPDCPFVHKHYDSENMQKLQSYAENYKVVWISINSSAAGKEGHLDVQQARDYITTNKATVSHYIIDSDGSIGKLYGAKTTPHMFVIDQTGKLAYAGAIDSAPSPNPDNSIQGATNYVHDAIQSLLDGKKVAVSSTQSYGCSVKYAN